MIKALNLPPQVNAARQSFHTSRAAADTAKSILKVALSDFLIRTAKPQLLQTADHHEYVQMLGALMADAGLEIEHLYLVRSDIAQEWGSYVSNFGKDSEKRRNQWPDDNDARFALSYQLWATRHCSNPFYVLDVKGSDPDGVLRLFRDFLGYGDVFEQAKLNWGRTKP